MLRMRGLMLSLAGALALAAPAAAQFPAGLTLTPSAGWAFMLADMPAELQLEGSNAILADRELDPAPVAGGAVGLRLTDRFSIEGTFGWVPTSLVPRSGAGDAIDVNIWTWGVSTLVFAPVRRLEPYVAFGIGGKTYDWNLPDDEFDYDLAVSFGGGVQYALTPKLALRLDARDHLSWYDPRFQGTDKVAQHDLYVQAGLTFSPAPSRAVVATR